MKEIKFRVWDKKDKKFTSYITCESGVFFTKGVDAVFAQNGTPFGAYLEVQQFTGIKDKNDVEIFEGDILQFTNKIVWYQSKFFRARLNNDKQAMEEIANNHVDYPFERRIIQMPDCYEWILSSEIKDYWEVIGNIHENPELMEDKNGAK